MAEMGVRLECLKLAVQVATAEALEKSTRAPSVERVADLTGKFYDLVNAGPTPAKDDEKPASEATSKNPQQAQGGKKPQADKDKIFS